MKYAILLNPGHSQVYFKASEKLSLAELSALSPRLSTPALGAAMESIAGVPYLVFEADHALPQDDLALLSRLSFVYAMFQVTADNAGFVPVLRSHPGYFTDDLSSMLKYSGKTNELFTRFMINVALLLGGFERKPSVNLLDPMAGKGTTLFEGLIAGLNVSGIELSAKVVHEATVFFKKYLETGKYRHTMKQDRINGENREFSADFFRFEIAKSKQDLKHDKALKCVFVAGDARYADRYFKKSGFDIIVGDLPYGVQHASKFAPSATASRSPFKLLGECLPAWRTCLAADGVLALAWNVFLLDRKIMLKLLEDHGLAPINDPPYNDLSHRVDQAILRDVVFCKKAGS